MFGLFKGDDTVITMDQFSFYINLVSIVAVFISWIVFIRALFSRRSGASGHTSREPLSWLGLVLQLAAYPITLAVWRSPMSPFIGEDALLNVPIQILAVVMGVWSAWLAVSAIRQLGKQWSLQARVLDDHKLITEGVYRMVRHPIYTAMLGMLISTGLAVSQYPALGAALIVFLIGTGIRMHLEEKLLARAFGKQFAEWRAAVPGLIPYKGPGNRAS